jgi:prepilin-type N-terminal cleavage/methylation domain-containing protein
MIRIKRQNGFSLLELILAVAIFSLGSFALATLLIDSNLSTKLSSERINALSYTKEGIEAARAIRNADWSNITAGTFGLTSSLTGQWELSDTPDTLDDKYTRTINITDTDPVSDSLKSVSVSVSWPLTADRIATTTLSTILTNWRVISESAGAGGCDATCLALRVGLVAYYPLDTNTNDYSENPNDGTIYGGVEATSGNVNGAYSFDGLVGTQINAPAVTLTTAISVGAWVKRDISSTDRVEGIIARLDYSSGPYRHWALSTVNGGLRFGVNSDRSYGDPGGQYIETSIDPLNDLAWHYVSGTYESTGGSSGNGVIYIDGAPVQEDVIYQGSIDSFDDGTPIRIGSYDGDNQPFLGSIDEVAIWSRALGADEVAEMCNDTGSGCVGRSLINE